MQQVFLIEGMHCGACVNRVSQALRPLAQSVSVTLEPPQALLEAAGPVPIEAVQSALQKAGSYRALPG